MKMTWLFMLLLPALPVLAQKQGKPQGYQFSREDQYYNLLESSKRTKTRAWISLVGGVGLSAVGLSLYAQEKGQESSGATAAYIASITGIGSTLASVPLFISAAKDKRKAKLLLKNEDTSFRLVQKTTYMPAVGIQLSL